MGDDKGVGDVGRVVDGETEGDCQEYRRGRLDGQSPEMHEARDVGDGDDDVDHDENGRDEVRQEEERRQEHAQL